MMYYKLTIDETGRNCPKDESQLFNVISESFKTLEDIKEYLTERYGKIPTGKNKVYRDDKEGNSIEVGFLHSFWNRDISHNSKHWFQTDWFQLHLVWKLQY